ncbi:MAG: DsbA family protein [Solirubrobacterales bacterium]|nr:DsbA family protein [Solirubrobacterales bacterium]
MTMVDVAHFTDAGCPWCYSAEPVRIALQERYGDQLRWRTVQVGLHESGATMAEEGYTTAGLAEGYRKIHERHGMPFCARERPRLSGTWAGGRAVKAAEMQSRQAGDGLLRRLRLAWFAEVRAVDEPGELRRLAADVAGLDRARFERDLAAASSATAFARDRAEARRPDRVALALDRTAGGEDGGEERYTTPSYVFSIGGRSVSVPGFQPREAYEVALQNLVPALERRRPLDAARFLGGHPGQSFATVEVAAAIGRSARTADRQLRQLVADGSVTCVPMSLGELWLARAH